MRAQRGKRNGKNREAIKQATRQNQQNPSKTKRLRKGVNQKQLRKRKAKANVNVKRKEKQKKVHQNYDYLSEATGRVDRLPERVVWVNEEGPAGRST